MPALGVQGALWRLGGVIEVLRSDNLSGATRTERLSLSAMFLSRTRERDLRLKTITCRRRTRFSASRLARDFQSGSCDEQKLGVERDIALVTSTPSGPLIPNEVFGSDKAPPFIAAALEVFHADFTGRVRLLSRGLYRWLQYGCGMYTAPR